MFLPATSKEMSRKSRILAAIVFIALAISFVTPSMASVFGNSSGSAYAADISKSAADLPSSPPASDRVVITLITYELLGQLADGVAYTYWTFNGTVPGPLVRLREGQVVEMHVKNAVNSTMTHSVDSHGIIGPGGGSVFSQTPPGQESVFRFRAVRAGLYVYHCATPNIPTHIANGMYGLMLVEPEMGLPKVDREFYIVEGEFYTQGGYGEPGHQAFDFQKAQVESPEYVVFNGRVGAMTGAGTPKGTVGETIRIFFGNGGPNLVSSFHVIGGIFDRVYSEGAIISEPIRNVQTTLVPAGGSVMVELQAMVPGKLILVDHSLFRINRGAIGMIEVEGPSNPEVFSSIQNATTATGQDSHEAQTLTTTASSEKSQEGKSGETEVLIENYQYLPADLTVLAGTTVTWTNKDPDPHTVTEGDPSAPKEPSKRIFDSSNAQGSGGYELMQQGDTFSFTFTQPGSYTYYCIPHPYMIGKITVVSSPEQGQSTQQPLTGFDLNPLLSSGANWLLLVGAVAFGLVIGFPLGRKQSPERKAKSA